jgi:guanylate kinase
MNKIIILTAPSGSGKTSITRQLLKTFPERLAFSVSAATRKPRGFEKNGVDYYFITEDEFQQKIQQNAFVEWEMVYEGKYYGTLKAEIQRIWDLQKVPVLDIDVKGAIHVQKQYPGSVLSLFSHLPWMNSVAGLDPGARNQKNPSRPGSTRHPMNSLSAIPSVM